jgi:hypothetical protein
MVLTALKEGTEPSERSSGTCDTPCASKQQLVGKSARRRRFQSWTRKALLNNPAAVLRPTIDGGDPCQQCFKATDVASVSKVIHTDNQLQAGQFDNGGLRRMNTKERAIKLIHEVPPSSTFLRDNSTWR